MKTVYTMFLQEHVCNMQPNNLVTLKCKVTLPGAMTTQLSLSVFAERFFLVVISRTDLKS